MRRLLPVALLAAAVLGAACDDGGGDGGGAGAGAAGGAGGAGGSGGEGGGPVAPAVLSVEPSHGPAGTAVTVRGSGFQPGAQLFFGTVVAAPVTVVSATELSGTAPAHEPGAVELTVRNPDGGVGRLAQGFTFDGEQAALDWVILQFPAAHTGAPGSTLTVFARAYEPGVTDQAGAGAGIEAELGVGPDGSEVEAFAWAPATFNADVDTGANDEWQGTFTLGAPGSYRYTLRLRLEGGPWTYADVTGSGDGFSAGDLGTLTVEEAPAGAVDHCILQFPAAIAASPGAPTGLIYGRAYEPGVTDGGDPAGLVGQVGFGPAGSTPDGSWSFVAATLDAELGDDDEHAGAFPAPAAEGSYAYAFRFRLAGGTDWTLCDLDGSGNGFDPAQSGTLTVAVPPVDVLDWGTLRQAAVAWADGDAPATIELELFEGGATEGAGQGGGLAVEVGFGPAGSDPALDPAGWSFAAASYAGDADGLGALSNDLYSFTFPALARGTHAFVGRVSLDGGAFTYVDTDGTANGAEVAAFGTVTVSEPLPAMADWAILRTAGQTMAPAATFTATIDLYEAGASGGPGAAAGFEVQAGLGAAGADPALDPAAFRFEPLPYAFDVDGGGPLSDDRYEGLLQAPGLPGELVLGARVRLSGGPWLYLDLTGSDDGFSAADLPPISVQLPPGPRPDWCNLQFPTVLTLTAGDTLGPVYGRAYEPGVTDQAGAGADLTSQLGYGPDGSDPASAAGWVWTDGSFNVDTESFPGSGNFANDEHSASVPAPAAGSYDFTFRFSLDGGASWLYCDQDGSNNGYDPLQAGQLTVN